MADTYLAKDAVPHHDKIERRVELAGGVRACKLKAKHAKESQDEKKKIRK